MLFTSYEFLAFLAVVFLLYYILPRKAQWILLLVASYVFYWLAKPTYLIFILTTTVTVYFATMWIQKKKDRFEEAFQQKKKELDRDARKALKEQERKREVRIMVGCLLLNLGILAVLKYTNFAIHNVNSVLHLFGGKELPFVNLILPMGISFYTFQSMGYLIDVYRGAYRAEKNPLKLALFVSFFPQLVQGPISRFNDLARSLYEEHRFEITTVSRGLQRILWGYFKKLVVADRIVIAVNTIIQNPETYSGGYVFIGMMFYAFELYADFTGGIDITIGIAQTLGIEVTENFRRPFLSKNIKEYWNRWHITMGSWFTDYIFYPISVCKPMLKLNKKAKKWFGDAIGKRVPVYLSSFVVWFATGIWHGASWNFIVWGLGNFVVIMISQELEPCYQWFHSKVKIKGNPVYECFQIIRTILLMSCLRTFDCYRDVPLTFKMFGAMFTDFKISHFSGASFLGLGLSGGDYLILFMALCLMFAVSLWQEKKGSVRETVARKKLPVRFAVWYGLLIIILVFGAYGHGYSASQFIYNQF